MNETYTLTCTGSGGAVSRDETIAVIHPQPTITLNSVPGTIDYGSSGTLTWTSTNATVCTALGEWSGEGNKPTSGTQMFRRKYGGFWVVMQWYGRHSRASAIIVVNPPPDEPEINILGNNLSIADGDDTPEVETIPLW